MRGHVRRVTDFLGITAPATSRSGGLVLAGVVFAVCLVVALLLGVLH